MRETRRALPAWEGAPHPRTASRIGLLSSRTSRWRKLRSARHRTSLCLKTHDHNQRQRVPTRLPSGLRGGAQLERTRAHGKLPTAFSERCSRGHPVEEARQKVLHCRSFLVGDAPRSAARRGASVGMGMAKGTGSMLSNLEGRAQRLG